jgi:hypothetical protein
MSDIGLQNAFVSEAARDQLPGGFSARSITKIRAVSNSTCSRRRNWRHFWRMMASPDKPL